MSSSKNAPNNSGIYYAAKLSNNCRLHFCIQFYNRNGNDMLTHVKTAKFTTFASDLKDIAKDYDLTGVMSMFLSDVMDALKDMVATVPDESIPDLDDDELDNKKITLNGRTLLSDSAMKSSLFRYGGRRDQDRIPFRDDDELGLVYVHNADGEEEEEEEDEDEDGNDDHQENTNNDNTKNKTNDSKKRMRT